MPTLIVSLIYLIGAIASLVIIIKLIIETFKN
jgi:hypothetical protein